MNSFTRDERHQAGKALRKQVPRAAHANWNAAEAQRDPIEIIERTSAGRVPKLAPIRFGRMLQSPFTFLRGSSAVMAHDLGPTPATGLQVQACGDCHLTNFGLFATPERNLIFDINDFDETHRAPWEWDLKRLATSVVVAARVNGFSSRQSEDAALACTRSYRVHMAEFAELSPLDLWYLSITAEQLIETAPCAKSQIRRGKMAAKARTRVGEKLFPKITEREAGKHRFVERPPVMTRITDEPTLAGLQADLVNYRESLPLDRRALLDRYRLEDVAFRVVGIGSVGTRCYVALLFCDDENPLLLQIKEANPSVLEAHTAKCPFKNQGQRVVVGQRLMQAASDIFLGWIENSEGRHFYVRQLRDMKFSIPVETLSPRELAQYATICGHVLARAHAQSGDAAKISGYLGSGDRCDVAMAAFAAAYADRVEQDHAALVDAVRSGRIEAVVEEDR
ncbi:MAG: DUF2252 domain-containing protein [Pirellulales bacterium]|nr:DUF2252 domain-containing protein [Pirellulales bacterium]